MFDLASDVLSFCRGLDKQEGRVLSVAWQPDGNYIAVGGADSTIRKLDVKTGRCVLRITLDEFKSRSTLVWDIKFLRDSTIVSCDSLGKVQFWNSVQGTLIHSHTAHTADVLCLAVNKDENEVYSAGIDQKIVCLKRVSKKSRWLYCDKLRSHSHDVRALALASNGLLASGGVDTELLTCPTNNLNIKAVNRHHPLSDSSRFFTVATVANVLVHQSNTSLRFWQLSTQHRLKSNASATESTPVSSEDGRGDLSPHTSPSIDEVNVLDTTPSPLPHCTNGVPKNFLEIKCKEPRHILSSAVSTDAVNVALSTVDHLWIYQIDHKKLNITCVHDMSTPCFKMSFAPNGNILILATIDYGIKIVDTTNFDVENALTIQAKSKPITNFVISSDSKMVALANNSNRITVRNTFSGDIICKVPRLDPGPMLFTFTQSSDNLVMFTGSEKQLYLFNFAEKCLKAVGHIPLNRRNDGRSKLLFPNGLIQVPKRENLFALYDNDCILLARESQPQEIPEKITGKRKERSFEGQPLRFRFIASNRGGVMFVGPFGDRELVVVERSWSNALSKLPPALARNQYGT